MLNPLLFQITMFIYLCATVLYFLYIGTRKESLGKAGTWIVLLGFAVNSAGMAVRYVESHRLGIGYIPLSNMYESMTFFSWSIVGFYLVLERLYRVRSLGAFVLPLAFLTMGTSVLALSPEMRPLMPALKSDWLFYHVVTSFLGYSAFALSFGVSVLSLWLARRKGPRPGSIWPDVETLEFVNYRAIVVGFLLFTVGILTGAVWANYAWGTYWSWDPKETWSLVTWIVYAILLHSRYTGRWLGRRMAYVSIVGFAAVLFTYWGVNYLLVGLHSYAG